MTFENCPQCDTKLPPPFKSSGRQVCSKCSWTNKPKIPKSLSPSPQINEETESLSSTEKFKESRHSFKLKISINDQLIELDPIYLSGIVGSIILFLGTFTPLVKLPIVGSIGLTSSGIKAFLIACSVASLILTLNKMYKWLTLTGIGAFLTISFIFLDFLIRIEDAKSSVDNELANNPFRGLADAAMESVHLEWGWIFLFVGAGLILNTPRLAKFINVKQIIGGLLITSFVGIVLIAIIGPNVTAGDSLQKARQAEAKFTIGAIIRAEQAYYFENDEFTYDFEQLGLSFDSKNYDFDITYAGGYQAIAIATPLNKKHKLKSYSAGIHYTGDYEFKDIYCETTEPSTIINEPEFIGGVYLDIGWSCGSDSVKYN